MSRRLKIEKRFGAVVRKLRIDRSLSQEKLAYFAGIDRSYQGRIERGEAGISLAMVENIAKAFGMSPGQLLILVDQDGLF